MAELMSTDTPGDSEARLPSGSGAEEQIEDLNMKLIQEAMKTYFSTESDTHLKQMNKELRESSQSGDHAGVLGALKEGAEITTTDWLTGDTGLHLSARAGHQRVVLTLLTRGLDPNI